MAANPLEAMSHSILRFIFWSAVISLPYVAAGAGTSDRAAHDQQVFPTPTPQPHGILRRFTQKDSNHLAEVLRLAQVTFHPPFVAEFCSRDHLSLDTRPRYLADCDAGNSACRYIFAPSERGEARRLEPQLARNSTFHSTFRRQSETDEFIQELARLYSESVTIVQLGHTAEGREMLGTKISTSALVPGMKSAAPKLGFVVLGPQHAREWRRPYSYKCDRLPKDAEDQMEALLGAAPAGRSVYGTPFNMRAFKHSFLLNHIWVFRKFQLKLKRRRRADWQSLRAALSYGFAIPPEWIRPVGEETGVSAYAPKPEFVF
ncbi:hypothetical protein B0H14DRAFT_3150306 [Mycena olivaceomarginata]|nr:hypothetical protein B0H14DRAFT_3150306 [Mycena olivaceomarginata]